LWPNLQVRTDRAFDTFLSIFIGLNIETLVVMAKGLVRGCLLNSGDIVDYLYIIVSAAKWAMTSVSSNGLLYGEKFWYQLMSGMTSIAISGVWLSIFPSAVLVGLFLHCVDVQNQCLSIYIRRLCREIQIFYFIQMGSRIG